MIQKFYPANENLKIHVGGSLLGRHEAKVSVFDSSVQGGDAVWEGLRVYEEGIFCLDNHLERLQASAHALAFERVPASEDIKKAIFETLQANGMRGGVHIRLTLTRGEKITSGMDPRLNTKGCCLIVLPEWKPLVYDNTIGIRAITAHQNRNSPQFLDSKIHHNNLLNNILAKIQANLAGADAAVMLDNRGFVAELNDTNLFMVRDGIVSTPLCTACLPGITRGLVVQICEKNRIPCEQRDLSLSEFYNADEVFATGTMGELTPVREIDGRSVRNRTEKSRTSEIQKHFQALIPEYCTKLPW